MIGRLGQALRDKTVMSDGPVSCFSLESVLVSRGFVCDYTTQTDFSVHTPAMYTRDESTFEKATTIKTQKFCGYVGGPEIARAAGAGDLDIFLANSCAAFAAMCARKNNVYEVHLPNADEAEKLCVPLPSPLAVQAATELVKEFVEVNVPDSKGVDLASRLYLAIERKDDEVSRNSLIGMIGAQVYPHVVAQVPSEKLKTTIQSKVVDLTRYMGKALRGDVKTFDSTAVGMYAALRASQVMNSSNWGTMNQGYYLDVFVAPDVHINNLVSSYVSPCLPEVKYKFFGSDQKKARIVNEALKKRHAQVIFVGMKSNQALGLEGEMFLRDSKGCVILDFEGCPIPSLKTRGDLEDLRDEITVSFSDKVAAYAAQEPEAMVLLGSSLLRVITDGGGKRPALDAHRCFSPELDKGMALYLFGKWKNVYEVKTCDFQQLCRATNLACVLRAGWVWRRVGFHSALKKAGLPVGVSYCWSPPIGRVRVASYEEASELFSLGIDVEIVMADIGNIASMKARGKPENPEGGSVENASQTTDDDIFK